MEGWTEAQVRRFKRVELANFEAMRAHTDMVTSWLQEFQSRAVRRGVHPGHPSGINRHERRKAAALARR